MIDQNETRVLQMLKAVGYEKIDKTDGGTNQGNPTDQGTLPLDLSNLLKCVSFDCIFFFRIRS